MPGVCMTCTETCSSGFKIGTWISLVISLFVVPVLRGAAYGRLLVFDEPLFAHFVSNGAYPHRQAEHSWIPTCPRNELVAGTMNTRLRTTEFRAVLLEPRITGGKRHIGAGRGEY
jgi:hypothetical protein